MIFLCELCFWNVVIYVYVVCVLDLIDIVCIVYYWFYEFCWVLVMNWFFDILFGVDDDCKDNEDDGGV